MFPVICESSMHDECYVTVLCKKRRERRCVLDVFKVLYSTVVGGCAPVKGARGYVFPPVVETPRIIVDRPLDRVEL